MTLDGLKFSVMILEGLKWLNVSVMTLEEQ